MSGAFYLFEYDIPDELAVDCNQENGNWVITLSLKEKFEGSLADKPVHIWEWEIYVGNKRYFWQRAAGWLDEERVEIPYTGSAYIRVYAELIK